ncbi:hypothetical protein BDA99DRAFT_521169 [Phascolomyces articulosus]|uniref:Uncharacterized protein n=1 Tax=Phascolomyces articulosus TaxID=60185 RepID=A0AAD5K2X7_9FUNG|nr:hypothetical protein BDA99DRAFT_521169 [Phascolomyces articulosus]
MKGMYMNLYKESPASVRQLKTFGFTLSDVAMLPNILECPKGYVCRMSGLKTIRSGAVTKLLNLTTY